MHPAYSVIFFTTATGAGYGLLTLLGGLAVLGLLPAAQGFALSSTVAGFVLISGGLLSSTFHLGHPERAWRALSQWRSSWLSREGVLAVITFAPTGLFAFGWAVLGEAGGVYAWAGILGGVAAMATVYATSMIYASLKAVPAWSNRWVPAVYLSIGLASGALLVNALAMGFGVDLNFGLVAVVLLIAAAALKALYWRSLDGRTGISTAASATGLGHLGAVRLLDPPHTGSNYLLAEMGYSIGRKHARKLRRFAVVFAFLGPLLFTLIAMLPVGVLAALAASLAVLSAAFGVLAERWLFFAEARHVVTLYYGSANA